MEIVFATELLKLRKARELSQEELAEKLFVTRQTISKWELDDVTPDLTKINNIATFFDIPVEELLFGDAAKVQEESIKRKLIDKFLTEDAADKDWHENHRWREWQYKHIDNGWEFLARYYWLVFGIVGMVVWAIYMFQGK